MKYKGRIVSGTAATTSNTTASGIWLTQEQMQASYGGIWPAPIVAASNPPPVSGYIGWYDGDSWTGTQWSDKSGNGNHATNIKGTVAVQTQSAGNGSSLSVKCLYGSTTAGIRWPAAILPSTYTLFHVTRQTSSNKQRIFTGSGNNWLSGFWSGATGVAYHEGWVTSSSGDIHGNNWMYCTDQNYLFRSNGTTRGTSGGGASTNLSILNGTYDNEASDWACAEVIVYNTTLSSGDYTSVENYLKTKYGL